MSHRTGEAVPAVLANEKCFFLIFDVFPASSFLPASFSISSSDATCSLVNRLDGRPWVLDLPRRFLAFLRTTIVCVRAMDTTPIEHILRVIAFAVQKQGCGGISKGDQDLPVCMKVWRGQDISARVTHPTPVQER